MRLENQRPVKPLQAEMQNLNGEEKEWLKTQGVDRPNELPRHSVWYRPNGSSAYGPSDLYHLRLYRQKGFPLKPQTPQTMQPWYTQGVKRVLGNAREWTGTATQFLEEADMHGVSPDSVGRRLFTTKVSEALAREGISVARGYRGRTRVLKLKRR